jgi:hypothetical protein
MAYLNSKSTLTKKEPKSMPAVGGWYDSKLQCCGNESLLQHLVGIAHYVKCSLSWIYEIIHCLFSPSLLPFQFVGFSASSLLANCLHDLNNLKWWMKLVLSELFLAQWIPV